MKLLEWLLRRCPDEFRRAHAEEIRDFTREERMALRGGAVSPLRFWLRTWGNVALTAVRLRRARRTRGRPAPVSEQVHALLSDLRRGVRSILSTPFVSLVICLTLAFGIGLNTAIYSVVRGVLIEPLPYDEPDRLVFLDARWTSTEFSQSSAGHTGGSFRTLRREAESFTEIAAVRDIRQNLTGIDIPAQVQVGWASENFFRLLGVEPILGPGFTDDSPPGTAVLSYAMWQRVFGGEADVVGRVVELDDHPYTIAGVLPSGFDAYLPRFPHGIDLWKVPDNWWQNGDVWSAESAEAALFDLVARLRPGVTTEHAQSEMEAFEHLFRSERLDYEQLGIEYDVLPLHGTVVGDVSSELLLLFGAVGLVLLVACANVMGLLLARARSRSAEISLRLALGAPRRAIVRLLAVESLLYGVVGAVAGVALGALALDLLLGLRPVAIPRLDNVTLDPAVLGFTLVVTLLSTLLFGLGPALMAVSGSQARAVDSARVTASHARHRLSRALVVAEVAVSLVLLIGAALLTSSLRQLHHVQPGFDAENVLTFSISLPGAHYERPEGTDRFFRRFEDAVEALPDVESAGVVWPLPLGGQTWASQYVAGAVDEGQRRYALYRLATPGFFDTMRIPMRAGRTFGASDKRHVVIVSARFADIAWPGQNALGRQVRANPWGGDLEDFEIIGVVENVQSRNLREPPQETIYFDSRGWSWTDWEVDYVVRAASHPDALVPTLRETLASLDPAVPLARLSSMQAYVDGHLASNRFALALLGLFAVVAAALAVIGLYGVVSYGVAERSQEIGIRMALGADRRRILASVLAQGALLMAFGVALGMAGAFVSTRWLASLLFGVTPSDFATFVGVGLTLSIVGVVACLVPARRATRLDPLTVLKTD